MERQRSKETRIQANTIIKRFFNSLVLITRGANGARIEVKDDGKEMVRMESREQSDKKSIPERCTEQRTSLHIALLKIIVLSTQQYTYIAVRRKQSI